MDSRPRQTSLLSPAAMPGLRRVVAAALLALVPTGAAAQGAIDPNVAPRAAALEREGERHMAIDLLGRYLATAPDDGRAWLQLGRSTLLFGSTALNFFALRYLQLDQAIAIIFSTPFIVAALGGPMLGEWIKWRRWTAIIIGFLGVLLVTRPGAGGIHWAAGLSAAGALCYAIYSISTRILARPSS